MPQDKPQSIKAKEATKIALINHAFKLYAAQGIAPVSLRAIGMAAGAKNSSAVIYHFGNKKGLIKALLEYIYTAIWDDINHNISSIEAQSTKPELDAILRAMIFPLINFSKRDACGSDAMRFLSRILMEQEHLQDAALTKPFLEHFYRIWALLLPLSPHKDPKTFLLRAMFGLSGVVHGLATTSSLKKTPLGDISLSDGDELIQEFIQYIAGGLMRTN